MSKALSIEVENQYMRRVTVPEAVEAIKWLKEHNGNAPDTAKILLEALELAVKIAK